MFLSRPGCSPPATSTDSHHLITGKCSSSPGVTGACAEACVDSGVLDILVSQPVFHKVDVLASVEEMSRNGVFEGMELVLVRGDVNDLTVVG